MDRIAVIKSDIAASIAVKQSLMQNHDLQVQIDKSADFLIQAIAGGGRILICGNGGSAADAQHIAAELTGRFYKDRPPIDAEALHVNTSYLTAVANDYDFNSVYARLVDAKGRAGDALIAISTSGNSPNVLAAAKAARTKNMAVIGLTGQQDSQLASLADVLVRVPSSDTPRIQECHILVGHIWCQLLESHFFPTESAES